jgi:hypothetical protein
MENYAGADIGTMFKVIKQKSRTPPHLVAFFLCIKELWYLLFY